MYRGLILIGAVVGAFMLSGCGIFSLKTTSSGASGGLAPGTFVSLGVESYPYTASGNLPSGPDNAATDFDSLLKYAGWTDVYGGPVEDFSVTANNITQPAADAVFFSGHGAAGSIVFSQDGNTNQPYQAYWGPGSTDGSTASDFLLPVNSRIKWIFALSSDTVAAPAYVDPSDPVWTANWAPLFSGTVRGIYGFWQAPGLCLQGTGTPFRGCDITASDDDPIAVSLAKNLYPTPGTGQTNGLVVHDAFVQAAIDGGMASGWSALEDLSARYDSFTGPGGPTNTPLYGIQSFYYSGNVNGQAPPNISVSPATFTLSPTTLQTESISDSQLASTYQPYVSTITQANDGTTVTSSVAGGVVVRHYYSTSGAIMLHGSSYANPMGLTQAQAQNAATTFVQNSLGMPSDAVLTSTDVVQMSNPSLGSSIQGYIFNWSHASNNVFGDAIRVQVDDMVVTTIKCTQYEYIPSIGKDICIKTVTTVTHTPNISYAFRMWRTMSSERYVESGGRSSGGTSIDAYTASLSLPPNSQITAYAPGYWNGTFATSAANGAEPAWIFTIGADTFIAVDAFTGAIIGQVTD